MTLENENRLGNIIENEDLVEVGFGSGSSKGKKKDEKHREGTRQWWRVTMVDEREKSWN